MRNEKSLKNLKRLPKGTDPGIRKPKGALCFFTRLRAALMSDEPWQDASIITFKRKIKSGDAAFWRMFFDNAGPEAASAAARALGVTVNVAQSQAQAVAMQPYNLSRLTDAECIVFRDLARKCSASDSGNGVREAKVV